MNDTTMTVQYKVEFKLVLKGSYALESFKLTLLEMLYMLHTCYIQFPCMFSETCISPTCKVNVLNKMRVIVRATCMSCMCENV